MTAECAPKEEHVTNIPYIISNESTSKNESDTSLGDEIAETEADLELKPNPPSIIAIKCGGITGKLFMNSFICPGIHQKCIKEDGTETLITPKEFTIRANKDRQKDWKGSIRIGKSNLRTLMEMGSFDFYDHQNRCSAKCQSRNYITPKEKEMLAQAADGNFLENSDMNDSSLAALFKNPTFSQLPHLTQALKNRKSMSPLFEKTDRKESALQAALKSPPIKRESDNEASSSCGVKRNGFHKSSEDLENIASLITTDPHKFWHEMVRLGTSDGILNMMIDTINGFRAKMSLGAKTNAPQILSQAIVALGLSDSVDAMLRRRNSLSSLKIVPRLSTDYSSLENTQTRKRSNTEANSESAVKRITVSEMSMASLPAMISKFVAFQKQQDQKKKLKNKEGQGTEESKKILKEESLENLETNNKNEEHVDNGDEVGENHLISAFLTGESPSEALLKLASNIFPS